MIKPGTITPVFQANKRAYESKSYRCIVNQGSTRSGKTYSLCQLLIVLALQSQKTISVVSPSLPHLKRGARRDFLNILSDWGIYDDDHFNKTDQVYEFPDTKSFIEFFGCDDAGKVRGTSRDILFLNEANLIDYDVYKQLAIRTNETIFIDLNPADLHSYCYEIADDPKNLLIHSTYKNNLSNLTPEIIAEIESLQLADENLWRVFGLGLRGSSSETIYTHWKICDSLPGRSEHWYGQDFGYNHPSVLVKIEHYDNCLYWDQQIYETKLTTADLIERYKALGI
ncbi:MAG TPA: phage terminase large subunit, partial [Chitinophagaceae bacterium]